MKPELLRKCISTRMKICTEEFERRLQSTCAGETAVLAMTDKIKSLQEVLDEYAELNAEFNKVEL